MERSQERTPHADRGRSGSDVAVSDEVELIRAAQEGCSVSFAALVDHYSRPVLGFLHRRLGNRHEAEDLAQETFVRVYRHLNQYRCESRFSTWLFTIASNLAASHQRRVRRRPTREPMREVASTQPGPARVLEQREQGEHLWTLAEQLPESQRRVLELRYLAELSVDETARVMGKTPVHVKVLLYRARRNMARKLSVSREAALADLPRTSRSRLAGQGVLP